MKQMTMTQSKDMSIEGVCDAIMDMDEDMADEGISWTAKYKETSSMTMTVFEEMDFEVCLRDNETDDEICKFTTDSREMVCDFIRAMIAPMIWG